LCEKPFLEWNEGREREVFCEGKMGEREAISLGVHIHSRSLSICTYNTYHGLAALPRHLL